MKATLLSKQFDDRFLMGGVAPIMPNLPGITAKIIRTRRTALDDERRLRGTRLRNNLLYRIDEQARHQRRAYIRVAVDHPRYACLRPATAFLQQLYNELGGTGAKRRKMAIEFRTDLDELRPRWWKERVEV